VRPAGRHGRCGTCHEQERSQRGNWSKQPSHQIHLT
jgi:hypothetical protein